jgi:hypothetical protein
MGEGHDARLVRMLQDLLALEVCGLDEAMQQAAQRLAVTLDADEVDVLLHDPAAETLVAIGTSDTPMGRRELELGLDRLPPLTVAGRSRYSGAVAATWPAMRIASTAR